MNIKFIFISILQFSTHFQVKFKWRSQELFRNGISTELLAFMAGVQATELQTVCSRTPQNFTFLLNLVMANLFMDPIFQLI